MYSPSESTSTTLSCSHNAPIASSSNNTERFQINVCSFNIRYDSLLDFGNKSWRVRKALVSKFIQDLSHHHPNHQIVPNQGEEGNSSSSPHDQDREETKKPLLVYTLLGLQEVLENQLQDIKNYLASSSESSSNTTSTTSSASILPSQKQTFGGFSIFSTGREAKNGGEHCTVMVHLHHTDPMMNHPNSDPVATYPTTTTPNYSSGTFWLSETPEKPSRYWDAACYRIATWVKVPIPIKRNDQEEGKATGGSTTYHLLYINTHWDHFSSRACMHSAKLIKNFVKEQVLTNNNSDENLIGVVVSGDFNCTVEDKAFQELLQPLEIEGSERYGKFSLQFRNSYEYCKEHKLPVLGKETTFNNWSLNSSKVTRIDHILFAEIPCPPTQGCSTSTTTTSPHISFTPTKYECCQGTAELVMQGSNKKEIIVISDHYPILVNFTLEIETPRVITQ
ncbi:hypothetical protein FDP41_006628 [Naegleria fowleri]|uniref:Endonuclease/exonuclease/phosphatase domain-containing protein n=1 Tax=Naegleria fowleri TaxID=5763 RepID=A0A6A5BIH7_NAEFO|nr:uncharacterized protein FDP41_006628 [Naegleria fowleri]KAF0974596.1 hypothetical protein FDP41_006628 [Naegleria fowleri]CAG4710479.1 unnamed protein product [Naegleria fowleri]